MARQIRIEVDGVSAVAELCEDLSPKTAEAFWQTLHFRWLRSVKSVD